MSCKQKIFQSTEYTHENMYRIPPCTSSSYQRHWQNPCGPPSRRLRHSPPRSCAAPPAPLPPFRARFRVMLLWTSGTGALTCENRSSVASFLKAWQLLRRMQSTTNEWQDSYAPRCMLASGKRPLVGDVGVTGARLMLDGLQDRSVVLCSTPARLSLWQLLRCESAGRLRLVVTPVRSQDNPAHCLYFGDFIVMGEDAFSHGDDDDDDDITGLPLLTCGFWFSLVDLHHSHIK